MHHPDVDRGGFQTAEQPQDQRQIVLGCTRPRNVTQIDEALPAKAAGQSLHLGLGPGIISRDQQIMRARHLPRLHDHRGGDCVERLDDPGVGCGILYRLTQADPGGIGGQDRGRKAAREIQRVADIDQYLAPDTGFAAVTAATDPSPLVALNTIWAKAAASAKLTTPPPVFATHSASGTP